MRKYWWEKRHIVLKKAYSSGSYGDLRKMENDVYELSKIGAKIELDLGTPIDSWYYYVYVFCKNKESNIYKKAKELNFGTYRL